MSNNELKAVTIGDKELSVVKLDPWKRLTFIADFQKEFLSPALKNIDSGDAQALLSDASNAKGGVDILKLISGLSTLIDGNRLEHWTKRILSEGLVIYTREDGQRAKMAFSELTKVFTNPADIIMLLKEVIVFNLEDVASLISSFTNNINLGKGGEQPARIKEVDNI